MANPIQALASKIRNLFNIGTLQKRTEKKIRVKTDFCRNIEAEEFFPYGFFAKAQEGKVIILTQGGNTASSLLLPVSSTEGAPDLKDGDAALWSKDGGTVIVRKDRKVEINGTDFGGLVKADELKSQLYKLSTRVDGIITAIKNSAVATNDGGATFKANMIAVLETLQNKEDFSQIKNDRITHGNG